MENNTNIDSELLRDTLINNLYKQINNMINKLHLPVFCDRRITELADSNGKPVIVLTLLINDEINVLLYITEDIYDQDKFRYIDEQIKVNNKQISMKDLIILRALRIVFNVTKNISSNAIFRAPRKETVFVRTNNTGECVYSYGRMIGIIK